jgi:hypothetical protein
MQRPPFREVAELGGALGLIFIYANMLTVAEICLPSYDLVLELESQTPLIGRGDVTSPIQKPSQTYLSATAELGPRSSCLKGAQSSTQPCG